MKKLIALSVLALSLFAAPALAANCNANPFSLTNGTTADASQVMANFNNLLTCANSNLAHNGVNSDITTLSGLTTPITTAQGGTGNSSGDIPGNAATATALETARTIGMTGDVLWTSAAFDGSGPVTGTSTIQPLAVVTGDIALGAVGSAQIATGGVALTNLAPQAANTMVGNATGGSASPVALTASQSRVNILPAYVANGILTVNSGASDVAWAQGNPVNAHAYATVSGTTVTIQKGVGVTSIVHTGSSTWTVTLSVTQPDTNYTEITTVGDGVGETCVEDATFSRTTTTFGLTCQNGGGAHDPSTFNILVLS